MKGYIMPLDFAVGTMNKFANMVKLYRDPNINTVVVLMVALNRMWRKGIVIHIINKLLSEKENYSRDEAERCAQKQPFQLT